MRVLKISLGALAVTATFQVLVVVMSGSVALLGDTIHNFSGALTAVPLGIAFLVGRRRPTSATPTDTAGRRIWRASSSWS